MSRNIMKEHAVPSRRPLRCVRPLGSFRGIWCRFGGWSHGPFEAVGYENAGYSNSTDNERNIEAGFGRKGYSALNGWCDD